MFDTSIAINNDNVGGEGQEPIGTCCGMPTVLYMATAIHLTVSISFGPYHNSTAILESTSPLTSMVWQLLQPLYRSRQYMGEKCFLLYKRSSYEQI